MKWMNRTLLNSKLSLVLSVVFLLGFLSLASLSHAVELDDTADAIECSLSRESLPSPINNLLFLPAQVYLPEVQAVFLTKNSAESLSISFLSHDIPSPLRGPPGLSA